MFVLNRKDFEEILEMYPDSKRNLEIRAVEKAAEFRAHCYDAFKK